MRIVSSSRSLHMRKKLLYSYVVLLTFFSLSCQKNLPNQPRANQFPATRMWIVADTTLHETQSRQHVHWYGEDPDGFVTGYLITFENVAVTNGRLPEPDTLTYTWTTLNDSILALPLLQAHDNFTIVIRAVDNQFKPNGLPEGSQIRFVPQPYWDKNANGTFDAGDVPLPTLPLAADPKGAIQIFPLRNTRPVVYFKGDPAAADTTFPIQQPDTTYTVATFSWLGQDVDGNNTITSYRIALNDTSSPSRWLTLSSAVTSVTLAVSRSASDAAGSEVPVDVYSGTYPAMQLRGTVPGLRLDNTNRLYLEARDIAGEYSDAKRLPDSTALAPNKKWFVKRPTPNQKMLLVLDYGSVFNTEKNSVIPYYRTILSDNSILRGSLASFDFLDIAINQPPNLNPALIKTLQLYDVVLWVTQKFPSYDPARIGLFNYSQGGGKVIFTTTFATALSYSDLRALNDFAPLDSTTSDAVNANNTPPTYSDLRVNVRTKLLSLASGYPDLAVDTVTVFGSLTSAQTYNMRRIYRRTDAHYIYRLDSSRVTPPRYLGSPEIACIDNNRTFVLIALPLHILNGNPKNLPAFFHQVIENEFGLH